MSEVLCSKRMIIRGREYLVELRDDGRTYYTRVEADAEQEQQTA